MGIPAVPVWIKQIGDTSTDVGTEIVTDSNGNSYVTGSFRNTVTIPTVGGDTQITAVNNYDIFIVKYDTNGNALWAKSIGSNGSDDSYGIALDSNNNVYVSGRFSGDLTIATVGGNTTLTYTGVNAADILIVKYDTNGNPQWAKGLGGGVGEYADGSDIATDSAGNVYMCGGFNGTLTVGVTTLNSSGSYDGFIVKYNN